MLRHILLFLGIVFAVTQAGGREIASAHDTEDEIDGGHALGFGETVVPDVFTPEMVKGHFETKDVDNDGKVTDAELEARIREVLLLRQVKCHLTHSCLVTVLSSKR